MAVNFENMRKVLQEGLSKSQRWEPDYEREMRDLRNRYPSYETATEVMEKRRQEEIMLRRYMNMRPEPIPGDYDWVQVSPYNSISVVPISTAITTTAIDDNLYAKPAPNPRDELEQRCRDKGLDPNFARELDLD